MRSTNRKRSLLVSGSVILLCLSIIVGMTWALFTDTQTVTNHLQAGDLDITLERIALSKTTLTPKGYLNTTDYTGSDAYEDFTNTTDAKWKNLVIFAVIVDYFMISSAIYGFCGLFSGYRHAPKMYIEFIV